MTTHNSAEKAIMKPALERLTVAEAAYQAAQDRVTELNASQTAIRDQIAALGGTPGDDAFTSAADWSAAKDEHAFALNRLNRQLAGIDELAAKAVAVLTETGPVVETARRAVATAEKAILLTRAKAPFPSLAHDAVRAWQMHRDMTATTGAPVEWPNDIDVEMIEPGRVRVVIGCFVDLEDIAA